MLCIHILICIHMYSYSYVFIYPYTAGVEDSTPGVRGALYRLGFRACMGQSPSCMQKWLGVQVMSQGCRERGGGERVGRLH